MRTKLETLEAQALRLDTRSRRKLVKRLILSLEIPSEAELLQTWLEEAERRVDDLRKNPRAAIPASAVIRRARQEISRRRSGSIG